MRSSDTRVRYTEESLPMRGWHKRHPFLLRIRLRVPSPTEPYGVLFIMPPTSSSPPDELRQALWDMLRSPFRTLVPPWSWKAAALTAVMRALTFFIINLRAGEREATTALIVEAVFAVFAGGLLGAVSQYLRKAEPLWATALVVWAGLPGLMLLAQIGVHRLARTPHLSGGLTASFFLSAFASAFTGYAMRRGSMLGGVDQTSIAHDMKTLPGVSLDFFLALPRLLGQKLQ